jgi:hypothetical protein
MKKLPIGIQDFKEIRTNDYLYVDKTRQILNLIDYGKYFFLSRPRRFGKSLLCSTLHYLFSGEKELFKGLFAYEHWKWESYPVIRLDMSKVDGSKSIDDVEEGLKRIIRNNLKHLGLESDASLSSYMFDDAIRMAVEKYNKKVVIILDEYDKPILDVITNREKAEKIRELLANFYINIKNNDEYIRFAFITGITKFTKTSIFSKLNNLMDITLDGRFEDLVGITEEEIKQYLWEHVKTLAKEEGKSEEDIMKELRKWYNGYCWNYKNIRKRIYNPFSLLSALSSQRMDNYWITSGTPTSLIDFLIHKQGSLDDLNNKYCSLLLLDAYDIEVAPVPSFLFQTGYYTIVGYNDEVKELELDYPNEEVKKSFSLLFLTYFNFNTSGRNYLRLKKAFLNKDWKEVEECINLILAPSPHKLISSFVKESHWHLLLYHILLFIFPSTKAHESTRYGESDIVIDLGKEVFVIEVKMDKGRDGIEQIKAKKYHEKYKDKKVYLLEIKVKGREVKIRGEKQ